MDLSMRAETLDTWFPTAYIPLAQTALTCVLLEEVVPYGGEPLLHGDPRFFAQTTLCVYCWRRERQAMAVILPQIIPLAQTAPTCVLLEKVYPPRTLCVLLEA